MKDKRREDLDFDFDVKKEKKPVSVPTKEEYSINVSKNKTKRIRLGGVTLDCNDDCLIIRRRTSTIKEKTLIALDEIESTKVKKVTRPVLLFFAIFFLVVCGVACYPIYLYLQNLMFSIITGGIGLLLFVIFLIIFLSTRRLQLIINFSTTRNIKYMIYETKMFDKLNDFIDEVYHLKHECIKKTK